jgi:hypothetical protein
MALNLVQHRAGPSVWDEHNQRSSYDTERWLSGLLAGALLISGLRRRSGNGLLMVAAGGALAWWAATGLDNRQRQRGRIAAALPGSAPLADGVQHASEDSFPASDPPSWTPTSSQLEPTT